MDTGLKDLDLFRSFVSVGPEARPSEVRRLTPIRERLR